MRILSLLFLSFVFVFAFDIVLNTGEDNNTPFAVLHLKNETAFTCKELVVDGKTHFECLIPGNVQTNLKDQSTRFFDLNFMQDENEFKIVIYPKITAKKFDFSQNLYENEASFFTKDSEHSQSFTFVFSPEFSYIKEYDGLDFDIPFPNDTLPYIGPLDFDSKPVYIPQSADINTYIRIKQLYDTQNYPQVVTDAQNAINRYKGSVFMSEFILYKLRAQNKIYTDADFEDEKILEEMIEEAKAYTRTFTSDKNYPEISYIMMRTYINLGQRRNGEYIVEILSNEYPQNYFSELARLDYADYLFSLGQVVEADQLYTLIYGQSRNLDLAARSAASMAKIDLLDKNTNEARRLIELVLDSNPRYFSQDKALGTELAKLLYENALYDQSVRLYDIVFENTSRVDSEYEELLKDYALALSRTSNYQKAKQYLDLYMDEYIDGEYLASIKEASDMVFFNVPENNATFLHERYKQLMNEYEGELALKALEYDTKLFFKEKNYPAVIAYKTSIEQNASTQLQNLLERAAVLELDEKLKEDDCLGSSELFTLFKNYNIADKTNDKKAMFMCLKRTSKITDAKEFINKNFKEDEIFYGLQRAEFSLNDQNYQASIAQSNEILNSRLIKSKEEEFRANYLSFLALLRSGEYNQAVQKLDLLAKFQMNYEMVELYHEFLVYCEQNNLVLSILKYAPKAIDFQNLKGINVYTPELEFIYLNALVKNKNFNEALAVLIDLLKVNLNAQDRAKALYIQAQVHEELNDINAQRASLNSCLEINENSNWQNLCREKLALLN